MPEHQTSIPTAQLDERLEALLFAGGSAKRSTLARLLNCSKDELAAAVETLSARLGGGLSLIETEDSLALTVSPKAAEAVESARKKEWEAELGDAGLEVLAIIPYRREATRGSIEYIRGVNSAATLRILQSKGLIERKSGKHGDTDAKYGVTPETYAHLGITHASDLPEYDKIVKEIEEFEARLEESGAIEEEHHA